MCVLRILLGLGGARSHNIEHLVITYTAMYVPISHPQGDRRLGGGGKNSQNSSQLSLAFTLTLTAQSHSTHMYTHAHSHSHSHSHSTRIHTLLTCTLTLTHTHIHSHIHRSLVESSLLLRIISQRCDFAPGLNQST